LHCPFDKVETVNIYRFAAAKGKHADNGKLSSEWGSSSAGDGTSSVAFATSPPTEESPIPYNVKVTFDIKSKKQAIAYKR
jgi:hypothetical protein